MKILDEMTTLKACRDMSIARFGDGELRLAIGGACSSQGSDPMLAAELCRILTKPQDGLLAAIPNFGPTPNKKTWDTYARDPYRGLYRQPTYGSSFITRPDNAPWIDAPEYWDTVQSLWFRKDVLLVTGDAKSLTAEMMIGAKSVQDIKAPRQHAYAEIAEIEARIGFWPGLVILCLGACATVLAARLARKGVHALDLGHMGMFMRHAGAYVPMGDLISPQYAEQNRRLHADPRGFGGDGKKHAERVWQYAQKIAARSICDYGCGEGTLKKALIPMGWKGFFAEYDPGMPGKEALPKPVELVACTDVLEHIEPDRLDAVLKHIFALAGRAAYMAIATRPANKMLPDGRNAHLIIEPPQWWVDKLQALGWLVDARFDKMKDGNAREVWLWLKKPS